MFINDKLLVPNGGTMNIISRIITLSCIFLILSMSLSFAVEYSLQYDANGNLIKDTSNYYEYNSLNQLIRVRENNINGRIIEEYFYDEQGSRIKKITHNPDYSVSTTYYIDSSFIQVEDNTGTHNTIYYHDTNGQLLSREDSDGSKYFYHPDHLGSTNVITDESANLVERTTYLPFGATFEGGNDRYTFTGKESDSNTDLMYYGARYYSPFLRQFSQPDMEIPDVYDPQQINRYAYARNNPLKFEDKTGKAINLATAAIGAVAGAVIGYSVSVLTQAYQSGWDFSNVDYGSTALKVASVGAVSGGVAGLTFGAGNAIIATAGLTGKAALAAEGAATVASSVAAGQASIATSNAFEGRQITEGLGNPRDMATDAAIGLATWGIGKTYTKISGTKNVDPYSLRRSQRRSIENTAYIQQLKQDMLLNQKYVGQPIRYINHNGRLIITDGHHHWRAAIAAGLDEVPITPAPTGYYGHYTGGILRTWDEAVEQSNIFGRR
jgi:RHS repeat-associated protein